MRRKKRRQFKMLCSHCPSLAAERKESGGTFGKPSETAGRKVRGAKVFLSHYASLTANYKGKPSETAGRKARGLRYFEPAAQRLCQPGY